jgi:hypothetical protein
LPYATILAQGILWWLLDFWQNLCYPDKNVFFKYVRFIGLGICQIYQGHRSEGTSVNITQLSVVDVKLKVTL